MEKQTTFFSTLRILDDQVTHSMEKVIKEVPLTLYLNEEKVAVISCSPDQTKELTLGYLLSNKLLMDINNIHSLNYHAEKQAVYVTSYPVPSSAHQHNQINTNPSPIQSEMRISLEQAFFYSDFLETHLPLFWETGGVHSGGIGMDGKVAFTSYDVGRLNVLDKIYGISQLRKLNLSNAVLFFSGRVSAAILLKAAVLGVPIILARSAPTDLALHTAQELNITVICFAREKRLNVYTHQRRVNL